MSDDEIIDDATIDEPEAETDAAEEVETEAVEEVDATAEEADQDEPESRDSSPEKKDGTQRRIDELTRLRRQAERERDYYRQLLDDNEKDSYVPEKSLEDFDYDEKYANLSRVEDHQSDDL